MKTLLLALTLAAALRAGPLTWVLKDAVFADGGTATGSFVFDASTQQISSYNILTSGGDTSVFPAFLFQNGTPSNVGADAVPDADIIVFSSNFDNGYLEDLELRLAPLSGLTDAGGVVSLDLTNGYMGECFNCEPYRVFVSGEMDAATPEPTPEPATGLLVLLALAAATLAGRARLNFTRP